MATILSGVPELSSRKFSWYKPGLGARGSAESSDFGPVGTKLWARLYNDAIDEGFVLKSHRSGRRFLMCLHKVDEDHGEVLGWRFLAWWEMGEGQRERRMLEEHERFEVLLIND